MDKSKPTFVIQWPNFGPYHIARLKACAQYFSERDCQIVALETAGTIRIYEWDKTPEEQRSFESVVLFPNQVYEDIDKRQLNQKIHEALDQIKPQAIAVHGYAHRENWPIARWCRKHRCPMVTMTDSKADDARRSRFREWLKSWVIKRFSAYLCAGEIHRQYMLQLGAKLDRTFLGYDVVDNDYFASSVERIRQEPRRQDLSGLDPETPYFLVVSRFLKRKNLDLTLRAYAAYRKKRTDSQAPWRLVLVGDGEERTQLEAIVAQDQIPDVTFAGFRQIEDLPHYYAFAGAFINPAQPEPWGLVVNEAMASGLPVLVSHGLGCAESLVEAGKNGWVFDPNSHEDFVQRLLDISSSPSQVEAFGKHSSEIIARWSLEFFAENLFQAFQVAMR